MRLVGFACNVTTANNGNTESAKPSYRDKSTASLPRQANLLIGAVPPVLITHWKVRAWRMILFLLAAICIAGELFRKS